MLIKRGLRPSFFFIFISMKKKLLLTMGCSLTQGLGCYDPDTINFKKLKGWHFNKPENEKHKEFIRLVYEKNQKRFLEYSWGSVLQEKLKYDRFVNMGRGGSSTSGQVKLFYEKLPFLKSLKEYDVLLIWLLPVPFRFSFYTHGSNLDVMPGSNALHQKWKYSKIDEAYIKFTENLWYDSFLEQKFYKEIIKLSSKHLGFKFLYTSVADQKGCPHTHLFKKMFKEDYNLSLLSKGKLLPCEEKNPELFSILKCHHPNEKGYKLIAEGIFKRIKLYDKSLLCKNAPDSYSKEWNGDYLNKNLI